MNVDELHNVISKFHAAYKENNSEKTFFFYLYQSVITECDKYQDMIKTGSSKFPVPIEENRNAQFFSVLNQVFMLDDIDWIKNHKALKLLFRDGMVAGFEQQEKSVTTKEGDLLDEPIQVITITNEARLVMLHDIKGYVAEHLDKGSKILDFLDQKFDIKSKYLAQDPIIPEQKGFSL